jgi:hypothetical protein
VKVCSSATLHRSQPRLGYKVGLPEVLGVAGEVTNITRAHLVDNSDIDGLSWKGGKPSPGLNHTLRLATPPVTARKQISGYLIRLLFKFIRFYPACQYFTQNVINT